MPRKNKSLNEDRILNLPHYWFAEYVRLQREGSAEDIADAQENLLRLGYRVEAVSPVPAGSGR